MNDIQIKGCDGSAVQNTANTTHDNKIIAVGNRIDERFKATEMSKKILVISISKEKSHKNFIP